MNIDNIKDAERRLQDSQTRTREALEGFTQTQERAQQRLNELERALTTRGDA
ncbi:hypothetical protein AB0O28_18930 [Microbispora sp. NPDC088329]|uniref:hypothetical protein n=1 Tax=Microbispora sp. NPDC088329 TaxID=3154869 RepID=UPI0034468414